MNQKKNKNIFYSSFGYDMIFSPIGSASADQKSLFLYCIFIYFFYSYVPEKITAEQSIM